VCYHGHRFPRDLTDITVFMQTLAPSLARLIDHTLLRPEATREDILRITREALRYNFASVCVNPWWTELVAAELAGSPV